MLPILAGSMASMDFPEPLDGETEQDYFWRALALADAEIMRREAPLLQRIERQQQLWETWWSSVLEALPYTTEELDELIESDVSLDPTVRPHEAEDDDHVHISLSENDHEPGWRKMYCGILLPADERLDAYDGRPWCERCLMFRRLERD